MISNIFLKHPFLVAAVTIITAYLFVSCTPQSAEASIVIQEQPIPSKSYIHKHTTLVYDSQPYELVKPIGYASKDYKSELKLLTEALFHEARGDDYKAVFAVIINRIHSKHFPNTITGVVEQDYQFSYIRDLSPSVRTYNESVEKSKYNEIRAWVHSQLASGYYEDTTQGALYYFAHNKIKAPDWYSDKYQTIKTKHHTFASWHVVKRG